MKRWGGLEEEETRLEEGGEERKWLLPRCNWHEMLLAKINVWAWKVSIRLQAVLISLLVWISLTIFFYRRIFITVARRVSRDSKIYLKPGDDILSVCVFSSLIENISRKKKTSRNVLSLFLVTRAWHSKWNNCVISVLISEETSTDRGRRKGWWNRMQGLH